MALISTSTATVQLVSVRRESSVRDCVRMMLLERNLERRICVISFSSKIKMCLLYTTYTCAKLCRERQYLFVRVTYAKVEK